MLIVGDNLRQLMEQTSLVDDVRSFDENSITLSLDRNLVELIPTETITELTYGHRIPAECVRQFELSDSGHVLLPGMGVLACSRETVSIPPGYFGLLQTKGSLARMLVQVNCCDGQVESGFIGKITFEMCNLSAFSIRILPDAKVAQLFIMKTSMRSQHPYSGRYQNAQIPTIQIPER